jgi:hypothetical protein
VRQGRFYELWQRDDAVAVIEHFSLGSVTQPALAAPCADVMRLAKLAGPGGRLATVFRSPNVVLELNRFSHPASWTDPAGADLLPHSAGSAVGDFFVAIPGRYGLWVGGGFRPQLDAYVDGRHVAGVRDHLNVGGQYVPFGSADLGPGNHRLELRGAGPDLVPGSGGPPAPLGPVVLSLGTADQPVAHLPSRAARSLCGKTLDWVEALPPSR